jgi:hypothetical protein
LGWGGKNGGFSEKNSFKNPKKGKKGKKCEKTLEFFNKNRYVLYIQIVGFK